MLSTWSVNNKKFPICLPITIKFSHHFKRIRFLYRNQWKLLHSSFLFLLKKHQSFMRKLIFIASIKSILLSVIKNSNKALRKVRTKSAIFFMVLKKAYWILLKLEENFSFKLTFKAPWMWWKILMKALQLVLDVSVVK